MILFASTWCNVEPATKFVQGFLEKPKLARGEVPVIRHRNAFMELGAVKGSTYLCQYRKQ